MVWGGFADNASTDFGPVSTRLNSLGYTDLMQTNLLPKGREPGGRGWVFQQDNASIHTSNYSKNWLKRKGITVFDWLAKSPDLISMENFGA